MRQCNHFCIEGLIGAGKSTVASLVAAETNLFYCKEPQIESEEGMELLKKFYSDTKKYGELFQYEILNLRREQLRHYQDVPCVFDRSILFDECFPKTLNMQGCYTDSKLESYEIYKNISLRNYRPNTIYLLDIKPEHSLEHIRKRSREGENAIDKYYLECLYIAYQERLKQLEDEKIRTIIYHAEDYEGKPTVLAHDIAVDIQLQLNKF